MYFSPKAGETIVFDYLITWPSNTGCYPSNGWTKFGGRTPSSRTPKTSLSKPWPSPITTSGFGKTRPSSTWSSKLSQLKTPFGRWRMCEEGENLWQSGKEQAWDLQTRKLRSKMVHWEFFLKMKWTILLRDPLCLKIPALEMNEAIKTIYTFCLSSTLFWKMTTLIWSPCNVSRMMVTWSTFCLKK